MMRASNSRLEFRNSRDSTIASCRERSISLFGTEVEGGGIPQHANYSTLKLPTQRPSDRRFRGGLGKAGTAVTGASEEAGRSRVGWRNYHEGATATAGRQLGAAPRIASCDPELTSATTVRARAVHEWQLLEESVRGGLVQPC
jgi:hypothetical protein